MQNLQSDYKTILDELKQEQIAKIKQRQEDKILEKENAEFLIKLIENAESKEDVLKLSALGMSLKRTGFHFDVRLEKSDRTIKYFVKNEELRFEPLSEYSQMDSSSLDSMDCHDFANAKSRNDDKAESCRIADLSLKAESQKITHTLIIGDNYPALLNLLINYKRKVKVIYIDPPYGKDDLGQFAQTNYDNAITRDNLLVKVIYIDPPYGKDDLGQFAQTNYDNAITRDNLLSMLYPRLCLAKMLLKDDGVIFCSIDDRNQAYVKGLFDEVFGEGNFVVCYPIATNRGGRDYGGIAITHESVLIYQKDAKSNELNLLIDENKNFTFCDANGNFNLMELRNRNSKVNSKNRPNLYYPFYVNLNNQDENDLYEVSLTQHNAFIS